MITPLNKFGMNYDPTKYKIWTWKNPVVMHWILNPGLAINELLFGQRMPKVTLIDKKSNKPLAEKTYIPCPHCETLHPGLKWSVQNNTGFSNWFGLYCDNCSKVIPCVTNLTSYLILGLTFPFWYFFRDKWKAKWLAIQKEKFSKPLTLTQPNTSWWLMGLLWGIWMIIWMIILIPLLFHETITFKKLLIDIPFYLLAGLIYGLIMKSIMDKRKVKT